jgi:catechol 2,3-dioxygenase-like lactoylglutathione lyase family enzyme
MTPTDHPPTGGFATLIPELAVLDLATSLGFWCDVLGFKIAYQRPERGFVYLERGSAQVMLEVSNGNWQTGELARPFGRGINIMIFVEVTPQAAHSADAWWRGQHRRSNQCIETEAAHP